MLKLRKWWEVSNPYPPDWPLVSPWIWVLEGGTRGSLHQLCNQAIRLMQIMEDQSHTVANDLCRPSIFLVQMWWMSCFGPANDSLWKCIGSDLLLLDAWPCDFCWQIFTITTRSSCSKSSSTVRCIVSKTHRWIHSTSYYFAPSFAVESRWVQAILERGL